MGKGDRKTRRGKIYRGSYGNTRPKSRGKDTKVEEPKPKKETKKKGRTKKS